MEQTKRPSRPPPKPGRKRGRPPEDSSFDPTPEHRQAVELLAGFGIPEDEIVRLVINPDTQKPISKNTLLKYFRTEIDRGRAVVKFKVIGGLYKNATTPTDNFPGGIPTAQIFWLKTQAGWKEGEPPAPPEQGEEIDLQDAGRRMAFLLAAAEHKPQVQKALPKPKAKQPA